MTSPQQIITLSTLVNGSIGLFSYWLNTLAVQDNPIDTAILSLITYLISSAAISTVILSAVHSDV